MVYKKVLATLKRYAFSEKMRMAHKYSRQVITPTGVSAPGTMRTQLLPWNLETFVLFAVRAIEEKSDDFKDKRQKLFRVIMECIAAYLHPLLKKYIGTSFASYFLMAEGFVQFDIQEFYPYKFYRYNYFFSFVNNKINMKEQFLSKFVCDYRDYLRRCLKHTFLKLSLKVNYLMK